MGQAANNRGRGANLDEKKTRAAGRINDRRSREVRESLGAEPRRQVGGATGKGGVANPRGRGANTQGAGGGGGSQTRPKAAAVAGKTATGRSTRPARKRSA